MTENDNYKKQIGNGNDGENYNVNDKDYNVNNKDNNNSNIYIYEVCVLIFFILQCSIGRSRARYIFR